MGVSEARQNEVMQLFASKPLPSPDKLRGGYYTPEPIARFVAKWVAEAGPRILEPSCGDGAILAEVSNVAGSTDHIVGVELLPQEAAKARGKTSATVIESDFFAWFGPEHFEAFDGVAGNPPYIRFGSWLEETRTAALQLMRDQGLRPNRLTNAWVPFVVASIKAVRMGGRVGLVIPAELLQVGYASELRSYIVDTCVDLTILSFRHLVFPGIQQEIVLLLATKGQGPAQVRTVEVHDASDLKDLDLTGLSAVRAELHEKEKWTKYFLEPDQIELLRSLRQSKHLEPMHVYGSVDVGVVTGRNAFFCMTAEESSERGLSDVVVPLVARSNQVKGLLYTAVDHQTQSLEPVNSYLLSVDAAYDVTRHAGLAQYIASGEAAGVQTGYKCRIRRSWWSVPSVWAPDAFMLRQISTHPRIIANGTGATSTDTVHRVRLNRGVSAAKLAVVAFNSVTFAMAETMGRSYGGGVLELEPSEAESLPLPNPDLVPDWLIGEVDRLVRQGEIDAALDLVDGMVLVEKVGFDADVIAKSRVAWERLRDRRILRKASKGLATSSN